MFADNNAAMAEPFISDLGLEFGFEDNGDFEFNLDDLDDLCIPSDIGDFDLSDLFDSSVDSVEPNGHDPVNDQINGGVNSSSPECGRSEVCGDGISEVARVLNCSSPESGGQNSGDWSANIGGISNISSPESGGSDKKFCEPVSSQDSGIRLSGVSETCNGVVDQKSKVEEMGKRKISKRKKEHDDATTNRRSNKSRMSMSVENANLQCGLSPVNEDDKKKKARLMRNRESAQLSRERKKHFVEELEDKVRTMHSTIMELNSKISFIMAENASMKQQLSSSGICPPLTPGMYQHPPMPPMAYPWVPYPPYVMKSQGSQVPLVLIPRLKPEKHISVSKVKKSESKKTEGKRKKIASVSFLGLLFFIILFGGLVPVININYGGIRDPVPYGSAYVGGRLYDEHRGRVLAVNGHLNGSTKRIGGGFPDGKSDTGNKLHCEGGYTGGSEYDVGQKEKGSNSSMPGSDEFVHLANASELLVASLYVPRNDKLVKIDGNLIIHSVLASEKAIASRAAPEVKNSREMSLAVPQDLTLALAIPEVERSRERYSHFLKNPTELRKALTSGSVDNSEDHLKSTTDDGEHQQWFLEGLSGPMLSSGICTEVFQFDVSPASNPVVITSVTNSSAVQQQNATRISKVRNRRILHSLPIPLAGSNLNITEEHVGRTTQKDGFQGNKTVSSMVVSVLVDPREAGISDGDIMTAPKALSRIFVVVLLDSVKYVTYSCVLPRSGLHLVTA